MADRDDDIDLGPYVVILRKIWWKVFLLCAAAGAVTIFVMFRMPDVYQAATVITPAPEEGRQTPALGALASIGVVVGGPSKVEDLETLFRSNDLTVRVFRKHDLWPMVLGDRFDAATGKLKGSWLDGILRKGKESGPPGAWDAVRVAQRDLKVVVNRKAGTLSIAFEALSPEVSANIVRYYIEEGKTRLQEEALDRAGKNKKFIEGRIERTIDPLIRDRLYTMFGQEVEREMLAQNREQFGFKVVDPAMPPDRKSGPRRLVTAVQVSVLSAPVWILVLGVRARRRLSPG